MKKEKIYKYKRIGRKSALSALDYKFYIMEDRKMDYQKLDRYNLGIRSAYCIQACRVRVIKKESSGLEEKSIG
jgi:hypothetical protein